VNLATLDLDGKWGETLADLACVEHIGAAFQNRCKHFVARPCDHYISGSRIGITGDDQWIAVMLCSCYKLIATDS
jgi:hypothetical protein